MSDEPDNGTTATTRSVGVANIPEQALEDLRAHAIREHRGRSDAAIVRHAVIEFAKQVRALASAKAE